MGKRPGYFARAGSKEVKQYMQESTGSGLKVGEQAYKGSRNNRERAGMEDILEIRGG